MKLSKRRKVTALITGGVLAISAMGVQLVINASASQAAASYSINFNDVKKTANITSKGKKYTVNVPEGKRGVAVRTALSQVGKPYSYGSSGPNRFDCSGLFKYAWGKAGVNFAHQSESQKRAVKWVPNTRAQAGDLIYPTTQHVAMYIGIGTNGKYMMVHASWPGVPVLVEEVPALGNTVKSRMFD